MQHKEPPTEPIPKCIEGEYPEIAWGIEKFKEKHKPFYIPRPNVFGHQVKFEMLYCGVCHSDCHLGLNDWGTACYPMVPGHELLGRVVEIGD